ncbi:hypothetical protein Cgig2_022253 [Carnegiea gigantea]|uniref:Protein kinase domain-containing protein n=1 Tax=Carnegiea gigantea TaxID=171969 RepID=A0A9Q1QHZ1_9CARY|nr:hypothetical protein Cgig2_022253 [Carnegiea gigantea]
MAFPPKIPKISLLLVFSFLCFPSQINSLSTVSISTIFNQTLVCALIPSTNQQSALHCTSFSSGSIQVTIESHNVSYSRIVGGTGIYRGPVLSDVKAGDSHVCGLVNGANALKCWQWMPKRSHLALVSDVGFSSIAVGEDFVCGLDRNAHIFCIGNDANIVGKKPSGKHSVIAAGSHHACAISLNGSLDCWGNLVGKKPEGKFKDVALGNGRSCTICVNGTVICWGIDDFRMPRKLQEIDFTGIVAKQSVFCGVVSSNYSLLCWGIEILDGNFLVFPFVMPGTCTSQCNSCGPLPGYGYLCGQGLMVCQPCANPTMDQGTAPMVPSPLSSAQLAPSLKRSNSSWSAKMVAFLVIGCVGFISVVASIAFLVLRCHGGNRSQVHVLAPPEVARNSQVLDHRRTRHEPKDHHQAMVPKVLKKRLSHMYSIGKRGNLEEFPLVVLLQGTSNFSEDHKMGKGSFGSVYRTTLADGREVAIKRAEFHASATQRMGNKHHKELKDTAFMAELEVLSRLNHKHLVKLLGFYEDANERMLVYEFMSNYTLDDHLHKLKGTSPLASWPARLKVALDAARGIEYLHKYAEPPIMHRDIKPSNILLDGDWTAKVSDFGLSLMGPQDGESHLSLQPVGTFGYVDPEYYKFDQLTTKSDVYSFGVVLLQLLSGYKAVHPSEDGTPRNIVDFVAPYIMRGDMHRVLDPCVPPPTPTETEAVECIGYLAVDCVSLEGRNRPSMSEVVSRLERALAACLAPPAMSSSSNGSLR